MSLLSFASHEPVVCLSCRLASEWPNEACMSSPSSSLSRASFFLLMIGCRSANPGPDDAAAQPEERRRKEVEGDDRSQRLTCLSVSPSFGQASRRDSCSVSLFSPDFVIFVKCIHTHACTCMHTRSNGHTHTCIRGIRGSDSERGTNDGRGEAAHFRG